MNIKKIANEILKIRTASKSKPSIFCQTTYRNPTDEELIEVNSFNLPAKEIINGFGYTMIGRGILNQEIKDMIINAITRLCKIFPDNTEYPIALDEAKALTR